MELNRTIIFIFYEQMKNKIEQFLGTIGDKNIADGCGNLCFGAI
jgi:hypothetical protein